VEHVVAGYDHHRFSRQECLQAYGAHVFSCGAGGGASALAILGHGSAISSLLVMFCWPILLLPDC
jgi:hypothetical protein